MNVSNKIVFNTVVLYSRMLITIGISLYATRLILNVLGENDYGIFNLVAGVVALLSFINITLSTSTQRYISISLGKGDFSELKKTFANSLLLHLILGVVFVICFEIIGSFFIDKLNIVPERMSAAKLLFSFVVITTFLSFISIPFDALNNSHENMLFIAGTSILESVLRLILALALSYILIDRLIVYGLGLLIIGVIIFIVKFGYCWKRYTESRVNLNKEYSYPLFKQIISFSAWNLLGVASYSVRVQGISVVLNIFFGTIVNAAYGIANQLNGQLSFFSTAMMQALQPQIVKSEGQGNRSRSVSLSILASKYSFILYSIVAVPFFLEMPIILKIWLKNIPDNTILFCRLIIILTLFIQLRVGIITSVHAIGRIKKYQLISAPFELIVLPIGYWGLYIGWPPFSILIVAIVIEIITLSVNILFFSKMTGYSVWFYIKNTLFKVIIPFALYVFLLYGVNLFFLDNVAVRFIFILFISALIYPYMIYKLSLGGEEQDRCRHILVGLINKIKALYGRK